MINLIIFIYVLCNLKLKNINFKTIKKIKPTHWINELLLWARSFTSKISVDESFFRMVAALTIGLPMCPLGDSLSRAFIFIIKELSGTNEYMVLFRISGSNMKTDFSGNLPPPRDVKFPLDSLSSSRFMN